MKKPVLLAVAAIGLVASASGAELQVVADRIAHDRQTGAFVATGRVHAVSKPFSLLSELVRRDADGTYRFDESTLVTTCTNEAHRLHWDVTGEVEYKGENYLKVRNVVVHAWGMPVLWVPYWLYPLDEECGLRIMPGYTSRWGAYLLTKYVYRLYGSYGPGELGFGGNTRLDLRSQNGIAAGQSLNWQLGDFGRGMFKIYYAWDQDRDSYETDRYTWHGNDGNWGSTVPFERYGINFEHVWEVTERDLARVRLGVYSDSYFRDDFMRESLFGIKNEFLGAERNEAAWEHAEDSWFAAVSVSGPLNDFFGGAVRLPEVCIDVNPQPVFDTPVNYESQTRFGYLMRRHAEYGNSGTPLAYRFSPGPWAQYEAFRFDTYHRLSAPFKVADVLSVVPRLGYRGTFWSEAGLEQCDGTQGAGKSGDKPWRSVYEFGVTFAARARAQLGDRLQHVIEPYLDVLAQQVDIYGLGEGARPYVFDSLDGSGDWLDQYAGRSRNLPYSWYGLTPGVRNVLRETDEKGNSRTLLDVDFYAALQFNLTDYTPGDANHRLAANPARPNYGKCFQVVPGVRTSWRPTEGTALTLRGEYDAENNAIAYAAVNWAHRVSDAFSYHFGYCGRNHRLWDFASMPYDERFMGEDAFNWLDYQYLEAGFEHELSDAVAWGPYLRWDCRDGEFDEVGTWLELRTDCLGFRFSVAYDNEYERIDGSTHGSDFRFGFYVYLRAFGAQHGSPMER